MTVTHEAFIHNVAALAIARLSDPAEVAACQTIKLVYGAGQSGLRGITMYGQWSHKPEEAVPFVEICALGQEHWVQVAGTTVHELGHVLAGMGHGHDKAWREACGKLGLRRAKAAGQSYSLALFEPTLRDSLARLDKPDEGEPARALGRMPLRLRPCPVGIGSKGGKGRSGTRLSLFECACVPPVKVRATRNVLAAHCDLCAASFTKA